MAATIIDGPEIVYGNLTNIEAGVLSTEAVPDPNQDAGPNLVYQGEGILDPRIIFMKDKIVGFTGVAQAHFMMPEFESARGVPMALSNTNIVAGSNAVSGTALPLVAANSLGISINVPVRQFSPVLGSGAIVNALAIDFGFGFGNVTAGSTTIPVGNAFDYFVGMPVIICPTTGAAAPFPTLVTGVNLTGNSITVQNAPPFTSNPSAIGTGDLWGPNEVPPGFPTPIGALPFIAQGPGLFFDARQGIARCISITGVTSGTGGPVLLTGMDIYGQLMTERVSVTAGATTTYSKKAFKYLISAVPQFSDAHTYSVGTSDTYGFAYRSTLFEDMELYWNGLYDAGSATTSGYKAADLTQPATNTTGDVRGTFQAAAGGSGTGFSATPSTSAFTGLVPTGPRLEMVQRIGAAQAVLAEQLSPFYLFGSTQA